MLVDGEKESRRCFHETVASRLQFILQRVAGRRVGHSEGTTAEHAETAAQYDQQLLTRGGGSRTKMLVNDHFRNKNAVVLRVIRRLLQQTFLNCGPHHRQK